MSKYISEDNCKLLFKSIGAGDIKRLRELLNADVDRNHIDAYLDWNKCTPLIFSALCGHSDICKMLLDLGSSIDATNDDGFTALSSAAHNGRMDLCLMLISRGADINKKIDHPPLTLAAENGSVEICMALVDHGAIVDLENSSRRTAFQMAASKGYIGTCQELIRRGADINYRCGSLNGTALCMESGQNEIDTVLSLLRLGADIEAFNKNKHTPLFTAIFNGYDQMSICLIDMGANVEARDVDNRSTLQCAIDGLSQLDYGTYIDHRDNPDYPRYRNCCLALIASSAKTTFITSEVLAFEDIIKLSPLEAAASLGHGALLTNVLDTDSDPQSLRTRADKALQIAREEEKHESVSVLSSWISRQAALFALKDAGLYD